MKRGPPPKQNRPIIEPWEQRALDAWVAHETIEAAAAAASLAPSTLRNYLSRISVKLTECGFLKGYGPRAVKEWALRNKARTEEDDEL